MTLDTVPCVSFDVLCVSDDLCAIAFLWPCNYFHRYIDQVHIIVTDGVVCGEGGHVVLR